MTERVAVKIKPGNPILTYYGMRNSNKQSTTKMFRFQIAIGVEWLFRIASGGERNCLFYKFEFVKKLAMLPNQLRA